MPYDGADDGRDNEREQSIEVEEEEDRDGAKGQELHKEDIVKIMEGECPPCQEAFFHSSYGPLLLHRSPVR